MKIALIAAALAASVPATAGFLPSAADSVRDVPPPEPAFALDLRLRDARGNVRSDLLAPPEPRPLLKPITPPSKGEIVTVHVPVDPAMRRLAPMPVTNGLSTDPRMPMKFPDPAVDYKLRLLAPPAGEPAK